MTKKVLFFSGLQLYPTISGGTLRSYALANALKHHGHDVFVYSMIGRKQEYKQRKPSSSQTWPDGVVEYVERDLPSAAVQFSSYRLQIAPVWITEFLAAAAKSPAEILLPRVLREKVRWADVILADFPFLYPIFQTPSARGKLRIINTHNIEHNLYDDQSQWQNRWMRPYVRNIEIKAAESCDILVGCSEHDVAFFRKHARMRNSVLVPNGIDVRRFDGIARFRQETRQKLGIVGPDADDVKLFIFTASKYGPNIEAFQYLVEFAKNNGPALLQHKIHIVVVGGVTPEPIKLDGFTATGKVDEIEPYFAAADAALNPMFSGAGTNVKMCEFLALKLPILSTAFGTRGFQIDDRRTGFVFEKDQLLPTLVEVKDKLLHDMEGIQKMTLAAYTENEGAIDMDACARELVELMH